MKLQNEVPFIKPWLTINELDGTDQQSVHKCKLLRKKLAICIIVY